MTLDNSRAVTEPFVTRSRHEGEHSKERRRGALRTCARDRIWFYCRHISRFYIRCNRLKKTRSALNIIDESFCFLEADSSVPAIARKLFMGGEGFKPDHELGVETLNEVKFDAGIFH